MAQLHKVELEGGIQAGNFQKYSDIYIEAMKKLNLSSIPMLAAEDETAIIALVTYDQASDKLLGFYGLTGENHQCLDHFTFKVGDGEEGYNAIISAFKECKIGSYTNTVLLNPSKPPTCSHLVYALLRKV